MPFSPPRPAPRRRGREHSRSHCALRHCRCGEHVGALAGVSFLQVGGAPMSEPSAAAIEAAARVLWSARMGNCPWEDAGRTQTEFRAYAALILEAAYAVDAPASVARPDAWARFQRDGSGSLTRLLRSR